MYKFLTTLIVFGFSVMLNYASATYEIRN